MPIFLNFRGHKTATGEFPTVSDPGWPAPGLVARKNDTLGAAILAYRDKFQNHPDFPPDGPWDFRRGEISLRDLDKPEPPRDEVPRYRIKVPTAFVGCVIYEKDQVVPFEGWPSNTTDLEPANESAERVFRYKFEVRRWPQSDDDATLPRR